MQPFAVLVAQARFHVGKNSLFKSGGQAQSSNFFQGVRQIRQPCEGLFLQAQKRPDDLQHAGAVLCQGQPPGVPDKERQPQAFFQFFDQAAQGRLGHQHLLRRPMQITFFGRDGKTAQSVHV